MRRVKGFRRAVGLALFATFLAGATPAAAQAPGGFAPLTPPDGCRQSPNTFYYSEAACSFASDVDYPAHAIMAPDGEQVYVAANSADAIVVFDRDAATGILTRKPGTAGCIANTPSATCSDGRFMDGPLGMAFNPAGTRLYLAAQISDAVLTFSRDANGVLSQLAGGAGCVININLGIETECRDGRVLDQPNYLAISPTGDFVYATSEASDGVSALRVDAPGTPGLSDAGASACVQNAGLDSCIDARALDGPYSIAISPDGAYVYVGALVDNSLVVLARNPTTGALSALAGLTGCVDAQGTDGCTPLTEAGTMVEVITSGSQVYAASEGNDRVLVFDRQGDGGIVRRAGASGCVVGAEAVTGCSFQRNFDRPYGLALSPDGKHLYVASIQYGVTEQTHNADGGLTPRLGERFCVYSQLAGTLPGCTTAPGYYGAQDVILSPDGKHIYTSSVFDSTVTTLRRDASPPTCGNDSADVDAGEVIALTLPCADADGDALTISIVAPPTKGSLGSIDQVNRSVVFAAPGDSSGTTTFTYKASSHGVDSGIGTFTVHIRSSRTKVTLRVSDQTPAAGRRVKFSGTVTPAHNGKVARIQKRAGAWKTVATAKLVGTTPAGGVARSKYSKRLRINRTATYRVRVRPGGGDPTGTSPSRRVRVH